MAKIVFEIKRRRGGMVDDYPMAICVSHDVAVAVIEADMKKYGSSKPADEYRVVERSLIRSVDQWASLRHDDVVYGADRSVSRPLW